MELTTRYDSLCEQLRALLQAEHDPIANMANMSALLYGALDNINWLGFYRVSKDELTLGPFQGKPACVHIPFGKGVCGTCAQQKKVINVADVHAFPTHIACDANSRSELVLPIYKNNALYAVLDVDSPRLARFDSTDEQGFCELVRILEQSWF